MKNKSNLFRSPQQYTSFNLFVFYNLNSTFRLFLITIAILFATIPQSFAQTTVTTGDMVITSKLITFHNGIYVARGGIKAEQKDSVMTADRGIYDQDLEVIKAIDNVVVTQPDTTLYSDYIEAYPKEDRLVARGNPKVIRIMEREKNSSEEGKTTSKTRIILTCNEVESFNKEDRFLAKGDVRVIEVEYRDGETEEEAEENEKKPITEITCEYLEMFSKEEKAICRNNVVIVTDTLTATGDKAIYLNISNQVTIVGHAHAQQVSKEKGSNKQQTSELFANKILYYPDEERTIAVGNVHATVYPGSDSGKKKTKDKKKDKKKKKKKTKKSEDNLDNEDTDDLEESMADIPAGDFTEIGGDNENEKEDE